MRRLSISRPDDWHLHLRDGAALSTTVPFSAKVFGRAIIMPNLTPPVTTVALAEAYRQRILAAMPTGSSFTPLMTLYLTESTTRQEIQRAAASDHVLAVKLYPAGATTNSASGVTDIERVVPVLETMAEVGMPLLVHGEVTDPGVDIFDRERVFLERVLEPLLQRAPRLKVVLEHVTTREGVDLIRATPARLAGTITAHHLLLNRNAILAGGLRPHAYCLPVLKRELHRQALVAAATSGDRRFFLGTDSAPHPQSGKESACGCAGIFSAHAALPLYAEVFAEVDALDRLDPFVSQHGPDFYGLPPSTEQLTLIERSWQVPESYPFGDEVVVPLRAGEQVSWQVAG